MYLDRERVIMKEMIAGPANLQLHICGLQRSGNHAIIDWIMAQHKEKKIVFLNNVRHGEFDPFKTRHHMITRGFGNDSDPEKIRTEKKHLLVISYEDDEKQLMYRSNLFKSANQHDPYSRTGNLRIMPLRSKHAFFFWKCRGILVVKGGLVLVPFTYRRSRCISRGIFEP